MLSRVRPRGLNASIQELYSRTGLGIPCGLGHLLRTLSTSSPGPLQHEITGIAVLGGGISGLASALYLSNAQRSNVLPRTNITIFESSSRLGGWLQSDHVDIGTGNVVFERGPRTLRPTGPNGLMALELVGLMNMHVQFFFFRAHCECRSKSWACSTRSL
jgi:hypothetical protein